MEDEQHLAQMVSLMGPPPKHFLERSPKCRKYWDEDGKSCPSCPVNNEQRTESLPNLLCYFTA